MLARTSGGVLHAPVPTLYLARCHEVPEGKGESYKAAIVITEPKWGGTVTDMRRERRGATDQILRFEDENETVMKHSITKNERLNDCQ